eukprot:3958866-Pyramimonas_sp.AAC.1
MGPPPPRDGGIAGLDNPGQQVFKVQEALAVGGGRGVARPIAANSSTATPHRRCASQAGGSEKSGAAEHKRALERALLGNLHTRRMGARLGNVADDGRREGGGRRFCR